MNCPNCNQPVRQGATFCSNCGQVISPDAAPTTAIDVGQPPPAAHPPQPPPAPAAQPQVPSPPASYSPPTPIPPVPAGPPQAVPGRPAVGQLGAAGTSASIWGPFAGYGTRREHVAWLLEGLGSEAETLRDTITNQFNHRRIPKAQVNQITLTGKGIAVEQRPFYRIQRGLATVWLYVARFGEDLYISQVSYIKGPISVLRLLAVAILATIVGLWLLNTIAVFVNLSAMANSVGGGLFGGGPTVEPNGLLISGLCCTGPFGFLALLALIAGLVFSIYKFLTEKDLLALLRSSLNEFQEDDIVSLEKAVNETVRKSADLIGIDLKLLSPGQAYRSNRRLI